MEEESIKTECPCDNIAVVKSGFSGKKAIRGFVISFLVCGAILGVIFHNQSFDSAIDAQTAAITHTGGTSKSYVMEDSMLMVAASIVCMLSLFGGTIGMNDIYSLCPKCGNIKLLKEGGIYVGEK